MEKSQEIIAKLKNGEPFEGVAQEHSEDEMKATGGNWGWINRTDIRKELADKAFSLKKGQFSDPVILNGYAFILYLEGKRKAGLQPLSEVRDQIEKTISNELSKQAQIAHIQKLRRKSHVKYFL